LLRRRSKRRYIAVRCDKFVKPDNGNGIYNSGFALSLTRRVADLYGFIVAQQSSIRDIGYNRNTVFVIRCNLNFLPAVLSAIPLMNPPALVLLISGTIKRLRMNLEKPPFQILEEQYKCRIENRFSQFNFR
jgi:hypothetical protein